MIFSEISRNSAFYIGGELTRDLGWINEIVFQIHSNSLYGI